jgi:hypothetical protein
MAWLYRCSLVALFLVLVRIEKFRLVSTDSRDDVSGVMGLKYKPEIFAITKACCVSWSAPVKAHYVILEKSLPEAESLIHHGHKINHCE